MHTQPKIYKVGGAVRDQLLGLPVKDQDWVVVGARPEDMLAQGYIAVGKDFPVFLHPESHEEYALARTERKTARGYTGFSVYAAPDVTLEQDLSRRDFTINAMAQDGDGQIIDPYGGQQDLRAGVLRHVSHAFSEDPVRILRGARFAARFGFDIAPETLTLMQEMVHNGEVDALVAERVWQELSRALMEATPSRFFSSLRNCGALCKILPEIDALFGVPQSEQHHPEIDCGVHTLMVLNHAAQQGYNLAVRFAALCHDLGKANTPAAVLPRHTGHEVRSVEYVIRLSERLRVPAECRDLAVLAAQHHGTVHRAMSLDAEQIIQLFQQSDCWRRSERFMLLLQVCSSDARGRLGYEQSAYPQADYLQHLLQLASQVNAGAIARACSQPSDIPQHVHRARVAAIANHLTAR